jgi:hypothetical protein
MIKSLGLTPIPINISTKSKIFRSKIPFHLDFEDRQRDYLKFLKDNNISNIVLLATEGDSLCCCGLSIKEFYLEHNFGVWDFSVKDFTSPPLEKMQKDVDVVYNELKNNTLLGNVLVHCVAGQGRTGAFLLCLAAKHFKGTPDEFPSLKEALSWIRQPHLIPPAVESRQQKQLVQEYMNAI